MSKKKYVDYVKKKLKKYKVDDPKDIPNKSKGKFFKELDKGWESKKEKQEKQEKKKQAEDKDLWVKDVQKEVEEKQKDEKPSKPVVKIETKKADLVNAVKDIIAYKPPKGLFKEPGTQIAKQLLADAKSPGQAMQRLNFYINRAGSNLSEADMKRLNAAKKIISEAVSKKGAVEKLAPGRPPKGFFNSMRPKMKKQYPDYDKERIDQIIAGIWHKYDDSTKKELTKEYEA